MPRLRPLPLPLLLLLGALLAPLLIPFAARADAPSTDATCVILKLDDLTRVSPRWQKVFDLAKERNIKVTAGIICNSLESDKGDKTAYYSWIKGLQQTGLVEFWLHGYTHRQWKDADGKDVWEFKGASYEEQKEHITRSQQLAKEKLGFAFKAFGAPFNCIDDNTLKALSEDPDLKVMLYGDPADASKVPNLTILNRTMMNIESPLFIPNCERVQFFYPRLAPSHPYLMIQGHPDQWTDDRFVEFVKIVDFLQSKGVRFVTPSEWLEISQGKQT
ncbi:MAG TPA: DUF2334 domain-containing protein, partial [Candidatus Methylacidiphilales bacterium]